MPARISAKTMMRNIELVIATPIPGSNSVISDAWVQIGGTRVTTVPVGSNFDIYCNYSAVNQGGGFWACCITVISLDTVHSIKNFDIAAFNPVTQFGGTVMTGSNKKLSSLGPNVMPSGSGTLQLRFRMWMNDDYTSTTPPDQSGW